MQIEDCTNMGWHERVGIQLGQHREGYDSLKLTAEQIEAAQNFAYREMMDEIHTMLWHLCKAQGLPVYERDAQEPAR
ncbi:hypothetical protein ACHMW5_13390 [Azospirillum melinis]|uniref:hypothetical protein n=1 Tax=Azospirillum melinis TaxID=328839 RepID=UPI0037573BEA